MTINKFQPGGGRHFGFFNFEAFWAVFIEHTAPLHPPKHLVCSKLSQFAVNTLNMHNFRNSASLNISSLFDVISRNGRQNVTGISRLKFCRMRIDFVNIVHKGYTTVCFRLHEKTSYQITKFHPNADR